MVVVVSDDLIRTIKSSEEMSSGVLLGGVTFPNVNNLPLEYLNVARLVPVVKFTLNLRRAALISENSLWAS